MNILKRFLAVALASFALVAQSEAMAAAGALVSAQELEAVYLRPAQAERLRKK